MRRLAAALVVALTGALPAAAQDDSFEARRAMAAEYRMLYLEHTDLPALALPRAQPMLDLIATRQPNLWAEKGDRITAMVIDNVTEKLIKALEQADARMADVFTMEELVALRDFYASEAGRSVMARMPAFMARVVPEILQPAFADMGDIVDALRDEGVNIQ